MTHKNKIIDPEIEKIKQQLKAIGLMAAAAAIILPFGLPFWFNVPAIVVGALAVGSGIIKYKESNKQKYEVKL